MKQKYKWIIILVLINIYLRGVSIWKVHIKKEEL